MALKQKRTYLEWFKEATQLFTVNFHESSELLAAQTTLDAGATPVVKLEQLTSENPEVWTDVTADVSVQSIAVVDAVDEDGNVLMVDGAVQFYLVGEARTEDPLPGDNYSFLVRCARADNPVLEVAGRAWLRIMP